MRNLTGSLDDMQFRHHQRAFVDHQSAGALPTMYLGMSAPPPEIPVSDEDGAVAVAGGDSMASSGVAGGIVVALVAVTGFLVVVIASLGYAAWARSRRPTYVAVISDRRTTTSGQRKRRQRQSGQGGGRSSTTALAVLSILALTSSATAWVMSDFVLGSTAALDELCPIAKDGTSGGFRLELNVAPGTRAVCVDLSWTDPPTLDANSQQCLCLNNNGNWVKSAQVCSFTPQPGTGLSPSESFRFDQCSSVVQSPTGVCSVPGSSAKLVSVGSTNKKVFISSPVGPGPCSAVFCNCTAGGGVASCSAVQATACLPSVDAGDSLELALDDVETSELLVPKACVSPMAGNGFGASVGPAPAPSPFHTAWMHAGGFSGSADVDFGAALAAEPGTVVRFDRRSMDRATIASAIVRDDGGSFVGQADRYRPPAVVTDEDELALVDPALAPASTVQSVFAHYDSRNDRLRLGIVVSDGHFFSGAQPGSLAIALDFWSPVLLNNDAVDIEDDEFGLGTGQQHGGGTPPAGEDNGPLLFHQFVLGFDGDGREQVDGSGEPWSPSTCDRVGIRRGQFPCVTFSSASPAEWRGGLNSSADFPEPNWQFASADASSLRDLLRSAGFHGDAESLQGGRDVTMHYDRDANSENDIELEVHSLSVLRRVALDQLRNGNSASARRARQAFANANRPDTLDEAIASKTTTLQLAINVRLSGVEQGTVVANASTFVAASWLRSPVLRFGEDKDDASVGATSPLFAASTTAQLLHPDQTIGGSGEVSNGVVQPTRISLPSPEMPLASLQIPANQSKVGELNVQLAGHDSPFFASARVLSVTSNRDGPFSGVAARASGRLPIVVCLDVASFDQHQQQQTGGSAQRLHKALSYGSVKVWAGLPECDAQLLVPFNGNSVAAGLAVPARPQALAACVQRRLQGPDGSLPCAEAAAALSCSSDPAFGGRHDPTGYLLKQDWERMCRSPCGCERFMVARPDDARIPDGTFQESSLCLYTDGGQTPFCSLCVDPSRATHVCGQPSAFGRYMLAPRLVSNAASDSTGGNVSMTINQTLLISLIVLVFILLLVVVAFVVCLLRLAAKQSKDPVIASSSRSPDNAASTKDTGLELSNRGSIDRGKNEYSNTPLKRGSGDGAGKPFRRSRSRRSERADSPEPPFIPIPDSDWFIDLAELKIGKRLGSGAFGKVNLAVWRGRKVAIKQLRLNAWIESLSSSPTGTSSSILSKTDGHLNSVSQEKTEGGEQGSCFSTLDSDAGRAFERECDLMRRLPPHPNVVAVYACIRAPAGLVVEYCARGPLDVYVRKHPLSVAEALVFFVDVCSGLQHLHEHEIIHRDLAARNLLLNGKRVVKICDFGLARDTARDGYLTLSDEGPLRWMAPEALDNREYGPKSDVYSFGITMWELIAGKKPYAALNPAQASLAVVSEHLRPPPVLPTALYALMCRCWANKKEDRPGLDMIDQELRRLLLEYARSEKLPPDYEFAPSWITNTSDYFSN